MSNSFRSDSRFSTFDATGCENEPIRTPGSIQSHGLLFAVKIPDLTVLQVSANVYELLGLHPDEILHQNLDEILDIKAIRTALNRLSDHQPRLLNPIPLDVRSRNGHKQYDGILHRSGRTLIVELEPHLEDNSGLSGFYESVRSTSASVVAADTIEELLLIACDELRSLTGYARVLAYQFDEDWNGQVIAESKNEVTASLMNHHFPSSDIPKQARELYASNWLRIIPDVNYKPSPLLPPINPLTEREIDLSNAVLRSVSPVHVEYMKNMGQNASMSVSLLKEGKLWGLISCHNPEPRYLSYETRVGCEFIAQIVSSQLSARSGDEDLLRASVLKQIYRVAASAERNLKSVLDALKLQGHLLQLLCGANGVAILTPDSIWKLGAVPTDGEITTLHGAARETGDRVFYSSSIGAILKTSTGANRAAGVLSIDLGEQCAILWFRRELTEDIAWSGDPRSPKSVDSDGRIHPRKSFETWYESVKGRAPKWHQSDIDAAFEFQGYLSELRRHESNEPEKPMTSVFRRRLARSIEVSSHASAMTPIVPLVMDSKTIIEASENGRSLLENFAELSVIFLDQNGIIKKWTAGAKKLFGYASRQVLETNLNMFFGEKEISGTKASEISDAVREDGRYEEETWLYRADKSSFWGKLIATAISTEDGEFIGYSVVIRDITREKSAEEELKATKIAAEAANKAKSAFLANISHEIRTPLGAVLGFAELLALPETSAEERENLVGRIKRNGTQLISLINDLLDLTKVEANKLEIELIDFDVQLLLRDLYEIFILRASEKSVSLVMKIDGEISKTLRSDPTRIRQILVNLIGNAIKFTPAGGLVTVEASQQLSGSEATLTFRIVDTGAGISKEQSARLFKPFSQADISTTRKFGGSGLGLFVSQRLARLLKGDVVIEQSKIGEGTTFRASVVAEQTVDDRTFKVLKAETTAAAPVVMSRASLNGVQILLVDDSPDNRHLIATYLKKVGATVAFAENGREGVSKALSGQYDIVLMDIQMPILDGNSAMRELRAHNYAGPVIALTAHAMLEEREHSLQLGFVDYLTKPIDRALLIATIGALTTKSK